MSSCHIRLLTKFFCTTRRRMPKHHCRFRSKAWERTTSVSWRSPTVPPPSWRSSQSGSSTPSTWTEAHSRWLLYVRCLTTIQMDVKLCCSVLHLQQSYKSSQHELWLLLGFYKPVPTRTTSRPSFALWICGVITIKDYIVSGKEQGNRRKWAVARQHALPSVESSWMDCWYSCMAETARCWN